MASSPVAITLTHATLDELAACLPDIRQAPTDHGVVAMVVRRPAEGARDVLGEGMFSEDDGLAGDTWRQRRSRRSADGSPHPDMQVTLMGTRAIRAITPDESRWPLAGDQLIVDLDLTYANLPPGTRLQVGQAILQVTDQPHTGCDKFIARFGVDAMKWVNSPEGRALNLRGIYAKVVAPGAVRPGDTVRKLAI
ncbi:MOSC domain-containing protein [Luteitalea sp. TBR-22]|uniref:MOSC domain-containing protein n=1 Tax=Luteitalea sp. TBR-22 TaxID=2802971 RepID=UPI001EF649F1|nr:MOSC domain-containing protein [Luteitalea sp. TBR-22]